MNYFSATSTVDSFVNMSSADWYLAFAICTASMLAAPSGITNSPGSAVLLNGVRDMSA